jgi:hypothetical protein
MPEIKGVFMPGKFRPVLNFNNLFLPLDSRAFSLKIKFLDKIYNPYFSIRINPGRPGTKTKNLRI